MGKTEKTEKTEAFETWAEQKAPPKEEVVARRKWELDVAVTKGYHHFGQGRELTEAEFTEAVKTATSARITQA